MTDATLAELQERLTKLEEAAGADSYGTTNNYYISQKEATKILEEIEALLGPIYKLMHATPPTVATDANPTGVAVSPDNQNVYVITEGAGIDMFARNPENGLLTSLGKVAFEGLEGSFIACSPDGESVYATGRDKIVAYSRNPSTGELTPIANKALKEELVTPIEISNDSEFVYLISAHHLVQYAAATLLVNQEIAYAGFPKAVIESPDGEHLYVAVGSELGRGHPLEIVAYKKLPTLEEIAKYGTITFHGGDVSMGFYPTGAYLYLANACTEEVFPELAQFARNNVTGALTTLNPANFDYSVTQPQAGFMAVRPDGRAVYIVDEKTSVVTEMPITRLTGAVQGTMQETISTEAGARKLAFSPDAKNLYVICRTAKEITCLAAQ